MICIVLPTVIPVISFTVTVTVVPVLLQAKFSCILPEAVDICSLIVLGTVADTFSVLIFKASLIVPLLGVALALPWKI